MESPASYTALNEYDEGTADDVVVEPLVAAPATPPPANEAVEAWFAKHFHGLGPMLDTQVYNILHAAKDELLHVLAAAPHK